MSRNDWFTNIENDAEIVASRFGSASVSFLLAKYGATSTEDLHEGNYPDVWAELSLLAQDD